MNVDLPLCYPSDLGKRRQDEGDVVNTKRIKDDQAVLILRRALCAYAAQRRAHVAELRAAEQRRVDAELRELHDLIGNWNLNGRFNVIH